jgi:hypothetical protein
MSHRRPATRSTAWGHAAIRSITACLAGLGTSSAGMTSIAARRHLACVVTAVILTQPACALLDKIEKISNNPGVVAAQRHKDSQRPPASTAQTGSESHLAATPQAIAFGRTPVGSKAQQTVVFSNPAAFPVTVVRITVDGCGFTIPAGDGFIIAPHGEVAVTVTFQPADRGECSGFMLLEIDSAAGRLTRVPIHGRGA